MIQWIWIGGIFLRIIYNQAASEGSGSEMLESMGIKGCYLKYIQIGGNNHDFTKKVHYHTGFEVHAILSGEQTYELSDGIVTVSSGELLLIPPKLCHRVVLTSDAVEKFSLCFDYAEYREVSYIYIQMSDALRSALLLAKEESFSSFAYSHTCITSVVLFSLSSVLRLINVGEPAKLSACNENATFTIAKRYIEDNICAELSTSDVADYCHLSIKQLTRIFEREVKMPLGAYIRRKRSEKIRTLLECGELTLREISEVMNFKNEYYFNAFVKKNIGMTPGAYGKMVNRQ